MATAAQHPRSIGREFDGMKADYAAARKSRFRRTRTGIVLSGSAADYHYRSEADYLQVLEYARDMDRNDSIVGQLVDRAVTNIIQDGIQPDFQTGDAKLDDYFAARWRDWAENADECDLAGEHTFQDLEWLTLRQHLVDGDHFLLPLADGRLQAIEGHRPRTPQGQEKNVVLGVRLDKNRRRQAFFFAPDYIDPYAVRVPADQVQMRPARDDFGRRQVFQIYNPHRTSQTRGMTAFAPIFDTSGMFEDINFAKLVQQQVVSCFAVFRKRVQGFRGPQPGPFGARENETLSDGVVRTLEGIQPGMQIEGAVGEELEGFSPNVPNTEYFAHVRLILTIIGVNLGMPLVMVMMDASETNFSGFRGAVDQARLGFKSIQRNLIRKMHRPVQRWKVDQWMAEDSAIARAAEKRGKKVDVYGCRWNPNTWPYIEPLKDASADLLRVRNGLISHRRRAAERGMDWDDLHREIAEDNQMAIREAKERARELNADIQDESERVHWRELVSLPTPDGVTVDAGKMSQQNETEFAGRQAEGV